MPDNDSARVYDELDGCATPEAAEFGRFWTNWSTLIFIAGAIVGGIVVAVCR